MRAVLLCLLGLWPALSIATLSADMVVVKKSSYSLTLMKDGKELKRYWIALGPAPKGHKQQEGDQRTPEGRYTLDYKKSNSGFYKAIHVGRRDRHFLRAQHLCLQSSVEVSFRPATVIA